MTALLHKPTHATAELHWLAEQVRIETDQRNFGGSWRSLRAARSDRHDLADREGPTRTMADQGGVTEDSRRNGPHCGDLPTVVGAIWRTNVRTPAQHYRHPDPVYVWLQFKHCDYTDVGNSALRTSSMADTLTGSCLFVPISPIKRRNWLLILSSYNKCTVHQTMTHQCSHSVKTIVELPCNLPSNLTYIKRSESHMSW